MEQQVIEDGDLASTNRAAAQELIRQDLMVLWAYRILLGREPENASVIKNNAFRHDRRQLVREMVSSSEFRLTNDWGLSPGLPGSAELGAATEESDEEVMTAIEHQYDEYALLRGYRTLAAGGRARVLGLVRRLSEGAPLAKPWVSEPSRSVEQADVMGLLRLVLGRPASDPRDWRGQLLWVGRDIDDAVRSYLTSSEFERRGLLKAMAPAELATARFDGFSIYAARDDQATGQHILAGAYEPNVTSMFRRFLRPGMTVVDVGANIGFFSMLAASIVGPQGSVTAVEPNPDNAKLLEASRRLNGFDQIRLACVAAAGEVGVLSLKSDWSNGTTLKIAGTDALWSSRLVPCAPLSALVPVGRSIDFIKIDVEGAEYQALKGMEDVLRRDRPVIVSEFSPDALPGVSGVDGETYLGFLTSLDLELAVITPDGRLERHGDDAKGVMNAWRARQVGHIDIVAARSEALA